MSEKVVLKRRNEFYRHVEKSDDCWTWTGAKSAGGYGLVTRTGYRKLAHRVAWERANGPIPPGMLVCHHCDNPPCVKTEPDAKYPSGHLFLGTQADNMKDCARKGRIVAPQSRPGFVNHNALKSHCKRGHLLAGGNLFPSALAKKKRHCRTCQNDARRTRRAEARR